VNSLHAVARAVRAVVSFLLLASSAAAAEPFSFTNRLADCEGRWVVLPAPPGKEQFPFGFVYVDPTAGFTLDFRGMLKLDAQGKYGVVADATKEKERKPRMILRIDERRNGRAALLPKEAIEQLGLDEADLVKAYADKSDPITHRVRWGRHYNHVGASERALAYLQQAYAEKPDAPGLEFELAYAYNALRRPDEAIAVLKKAVAREPEDVLLGNELAFAYLNSGKLDSAVELYLKLVPRCGEDQLVTKSEMAMNLSTAYERLGDKVNAEKWRADAKAWAPPGSQLYKYLNR
jgi:tetratricopeptide (TPR) repeat protein